MGSQTRKDVGFPSNQVKGFDFYFSPGCGGSGAGFCYNPATYSYLYWPIKVNPFSRRNNLLVLRLEDWLPFTDTPSGLCTHNEGSRIEFDVYLYYTEPSGALDYDAATAKITVPTSSTLPITLEFQEQDLPQPTGAGYERRIWVVVDLRATGYMTGGVAQQTELMRTVKLDYEATP